MDLKSSTVLITPSLMTIHRCFNCNIDIVQPKIEPLDPEEQPLPTYFVDGQGNVIAGRNAEMQQSNSNGGFNQPSSLDRLIYVFELNSSAIENLTKLVTSDGGGELNLCLSCDELLKSMYVTRQLFLQATRAESGFSQVLDINKHKQYDQNGKGIRKRKRSEKKQSTARVVEFVNENSNMERMETDFEHDDHHFEDIHDQNHNDGENRTESEETSKFIEASPKETVSSQVLLPQIKQASIILERLKIPNPKKPRPRSKRTKAKSEMGKSEPKPKRPKVRRERKKERKKPSQCPKCEKIYSSPWSLKIHLKKNACDSRHSRLAEHNPSSICYTFTCPICGNPSLPAGGGRFEQHLRTHMNVGEKAEELICCGTTYKTFKEVRDHRKSNTSCTAVKAQLPLNRPTAKRMSMCPTCGKVINSVVPNALKHHMDLMHAKISKYVCDICGRPCPSLKSLKKHKFTHCNRQERKVLEVQRVRTALCQLCGREFFTRDHLKTHVKKIHKIGLSEVDGYMGVVTLEVEQVEINKVEDIVIEASIPFEYHQPIDVSTE